MVGAITSEQAHQLAEQITGALNRGEHAAEIPKAAPLTKGEKIAVDFPSSQTVLRLAQIGIDHHNPDYFPLAVGNYILGGGALTSILAHEVREKRGLTYGVTSQFMPMPGQGPYLISLSTQNKTAALALQITEDTLKTFIDKGPSEEELKAAKQFLMGSFPMSLSSNSSISAMLLKINFYHLPKNYLDNYLIYINRVSVTDIKEAFQRLVHPDKMLTIMVGRK
jgi:zinc protease